MANLPGHGQRWWQTWPAIIVGLLLCLPLGLVGLWTRPGLGTRVRLWLTGGAAVFVVFALASQGGPHASDDAARSPNPTAGRSPLRSPSADDRALTQSATPTRTPGPTATPTPELVSVPDLTGLGRADAVAALKAVGLAVGSVSRSPSGGAPNVVIGQGVGSGARVQPGSTVDVVIATPLPEIPDVVGLSKSVAVSRLSAAGFTATISTTPTTSGPDTVVLGQEPKASVRAARGSAVHLTVAELHNAPQLASNCTPGYSPCLPPASDYDCAGGSGNGPEYVAGPVKVTGSDPYGLDADHDGVGCE